MGYLSIEEFRDVEKLKKSFGSHGVRNLLLFGDSRLYYEGDKLSDAEVCGIDIKKLVKHSHNPDGSLSDEALEFFNNHVRIIEKDDIEEHSEYVEDSLVELGNSEASLEDFDLRMARKIYSGLGEGMQLELRYISDSAGNHYGFGIWATNIPIFEEGFEICLELHYCVGMFEDMYRKFVIGEIEERKRISDPYSLWETINQMDPSRIKESAFLLALYSTHGAKFLEGFLEGEFEIPLLAEIVPNIPKAMDILLGVDDVRLVVKNTLYVGDEVEGESTFDEDTEEWRDPEVDVEYGYEYDSVEGTKFAYYEISTNGVNLIQYADIFDRTVYTLDRFDPVTLLRYFYVKNPSLFDRPAKVSKPYCREELSLPMYLEVEGKKVLFLGEKQKFYIREYGLPYDISEGEIDEFYVLEKVGWRTYSREELDALPSDHTAFF